MVDVIGVCEKVLARLVEMDWEGNKTDSLGQLIFPAKGGVKRISEQELRQLFIEEFKETSKELVDKLYYSIETPTKAKYKFGKTEECIKVCKEIDKEKGQSALLDMCVFGKEGVKYKRVLNIEFKHQNAALKNIAKDILKLVHEEQNGAFILLLKNTNSGTLCNKGGTGVFDKFNKSFNDFKSNWNNKNKSIQLIIMSLEQEKFIHREMKKVDLDNLKKIFYTDKDCGNINWANGNGWQTIDVKLVQELDIVVKNNVIHGQI